MKAHPLLVLLLFGLLSSFPSGGRAQGTDDTAIKTLQARQADAWNRHDAKAYAALFAEDGDVVNVLGWWWRGRAQIERKLTVAFAGIFRDSHLAITEVTVRQLDDSLAVAHVRWEMHGAKAPPGASAPPRQGIQLQVLRKAGGSWHIVSFQNTNSLPERPFAPAARSPVPAPRP